MRNGDIILAYSVHTSELPSKTPDLRIQVRLGVLQRREMLLHYPDLRHERCVTLE